jgi:hypothetical protein
MWMGQAKTSPAMTPQLPATHWAARRRYEPSVSRQTPRDISSGRLWLDISVQQTYPQTPANPLWFTVHNPDCARTEL